MANYTDSEANARQAGVPQTNIGNKKSTIGSTDASYVKGSFDPSKVRLKAGKDNSEVLNPDTQTEIPSSAYSKLPDTPMGSVDASINAPKPLDPNSTQVPFDQALKALPNQNDRSAVGALAQKYQTGFQTTKASGTPPPPTMGGASATINNSVPPPPADTSNIDTALEADKGYQNLLADRKEYNDVTQHKSLVDTYSQMIKKAGIPSIDTELLNTKKIIDGTEDDIRKEVQAVSGFATDSQVLALASARNKTLIANYNNLLDTKQMAMDNIKTMIGLAQTDQETAEKNIIAKMGIDEKLMSYRDKFIDNAKEGYSNVLKAVGYSGLYNSLASSGDPTAIGLAERTLGLQKGQLQQLATAPISEEDQLDLKLKKANIANIYSQIGERNEIVGGVPEKVMTKIQSSPEYKTINGVLPALQALKSYKDAVEKYGTTEQFSGGGKGELAGSYGNAIAAWKTLAGLGALSGADFALAENAVPSTGFFQRSSTMKGKLDASINNAILQAENLTKRLQQNYPQASDNLQRQLDEAKVIAYPDKFKVGTDGEVYELTN